MNLNKQKLFVMFTVVYTVKMVVLAQVFYNQRKTHLKYVNAGMDSKDSMKYFEKTLTILELQNSFAKLKRAYAITFTSRKVVHTIISLYSL